MQKYYFTKKLSKLALFLVLICTFSFIETKIFLHVDELSGMTIQQKEQFAIEIFLKFLNPSIIDEDLKFDNFLPYLMLLLEGNNGRVDLLESLRKLQISRSGWKLIDKASNAYKIGLALKEHFNDLPSEVQKELNKKTLNEKIKVIASRL